MNLIKSSLLAMVLFATVVSCSKDEAVVVEEADYTIDLNLAQETNWELADAILDLVNQHRVSEGLTELKRDQTYASAYAVEHTQYMIRKAMISHDNFNVRSKALKERGALIVGENVAYGYETAEDVVFAWLNSPGHKKIIEGLYTHSGFGIIQNERGDYYFTQLFYRK
ncbi:MAG: CAP domain-containing protein [Bacteroidia bacterium]|nr:CAP domain-containing protein [Bacteroidia bacterium]MBT8274555.1 CAP domain-containing protein [Bacteroidia bacterium]NNJ81881.1 CAP domain-containing protein [Flavobacteriaceae bacterium]NNK53982.1 CAP domain-containing protein [Flavobacteriaceae bacterium]NNM07559.1 CAP domain-containing protein [Flavobacteriaceae bacterium]